MPRDLVRLAAFLVRVGHTDDRVIVECQSLRPKIGTATCQEGLKRALPLIRRLCKKETAPPPPSRW
jgi:hypothetical protein